MIVVTVELWPHGQKARASHLGTAKIWNDGSGTMTRGNYKATLSRRGQPDSVWKGGTLQRFARKRLLAWDLVGLILAVILSDRWLAKPL